ncbi:Uncharacterized protein dnm_006060 [Desulfonema magnum]|uniref:Uncharacterized protein n=1 Tax=Desulfonema magnum TaxID=45655 RepID=A0A975BFM2_9BACT|nr:Uncharacterized protein dnm_006060 [Desulfonema magnum]
MIIRKNVVSINPCCQRFAGDFSNTLLSFLRNFSEKIGIFLIYNFFVQM